MWPLASHGPSSVTWLRRTFYKRLLLWADPIEMQPGSEKLGDHVPASLCGWTPAHGVSFPQPREGPSLGQGTWALQR